MGREIKTNLNNVLSIIACADTYGFRDSVLFDAFAEMLDKKLSMEEIEIYAQSILNTEGYNEEDYEYIKMQLTDFKKEYCD